MTATLIPGGTGCICAVDGSSSRAGGADCRNNRDCCTCAAALVAAATAAALVAATTAAAVAVSDDELDAAAGAAKLMLVHLGRSWPSCSSRATTAVCALVRCNGSSAQAYSASVVPNAAVTVASTGAAVTAAAAAAAAFISGGGSSSTPGTCALLRNCCEAQLRWSLGEVLPVAAAPCNSFPCAWMVQLHGWQLVQPGCGPVCCAFWVSRCGHASNKQQRRLWSHGGCQHWSSSAVFPLCMCVYSGVLPAVCSGLLINATGQKDCFDA